MFLNLKLKGGGNVVVNTDHIVTVQPLDGGGSRLALTAAADGPGPGHVDVELSLSATANLLNMSLGAARRALTNLDQVLDKLT